MRMNMSGLLSTYVQLHSTYNYLPSVCTCIYMCTYEAHSQYSALVSLHAHSANSTPPIPRYYSIAQSASSPSSTQYSSRYSVLYNLNFVTSLALHLSLNFCPISFALLYSALLYSALLYSALLYSTLLYSLCSPLSYS